MTKILVQPDLLRNLGQQFVQLASELEHIGSTLQSSLHNLQWELHHAQEVMEHFNVTQQSLSQVHQYLQHASQKLTHTADSFAQADGQSTSSIQHHGPTYSLPYVHGTQNSTYFPSHQTHQVTQTFTHNTNSSAVSNPGWASGLFSGLAGIGGAITQGLSNAMHAGQQMMNAVGDFASHVNWGDIGEGATTIAGGIAETAGGLATITGSGILEAISAGTATPVTIATGVSGGLMMGDGLSKAFGGAEKIWHSNDADRQAADGTGLGGFVNAATGVLEQFLGSHGGSGSHGKK